MSQDKVCCPKCNSDQIFAGKKGFSGKKAVAGTLLTGGLIGIAAGTLGSNKVKITCLKCGHVFKPGETSDDKKESNLNYFSIRDKFLASYEAGQPEKHFDSLMKEGKGILPKNIITPEELYNYAKSEKVNSQKGCLIFIIIAVAALIIYLASRN